MVYQLSNPIISVKYLENNRKPTGGSTYNSNPYHCTTFELYIKSMSTNYFLRLVEGGGGG